MKKILAIALVAAMLTGVLAVFAQAEEATATKVPECAESQKKPDWLITEIVSDTKGDGVKNTTYTDNKDPFEFIEIYNNSNKVLNLYDYCLTYNGSGNTSSNWETQIKEITPFLTGNKWEDKVGNYLDGSNIPLADTRAMNDSMKNPQYCDVQPGECVVLWVMYYEAYLSIFNDGTGMTDADFRTHHGVPDDVKVIHVDGNSSADNGGNVHNFNVKNNDNGTYGIAKYSDALNTACNVAKEDGTQADGLLTENGYAKYEDMISWASVDLTSSSNSFGKYYKGSENNSYNFVPDVTWANSEKYGYVWSGGRMMMLESDALVTPGKLTDHQKLFICPEKLEAGTKIDLDASNTMYRIYAPLPVIETTETVRYEFGGYIINGEKYPINGDFTVPADGVKSLSYYYDEKSRTLPPDDEDDDPPPTTTKTTENTTKAPESSATTTAAPKGTDGNDTEEPAPAKKGCGGIAVAAQLIALFCGSMAFIVIKKKK